MTFSLERMVCPFAWFDGWGQHVCQRPASHDGCHTCRCDAATDENTNEATQ